MRLFLWWLLSLCFSALKKLNLVLPFNKKKKKKEGREGEREGKREGEEEGRRRGRKGGVT